MTSMMIKNNIRAFFLTCLMLPLSHFNGWSQSSNNPFEILSRVEKKTKPYSDSTRKLQTRVWEEVRTKRNLSYAPSAGYRPARNSTSYLYVTTTQPDTAIKVMFAEVDRLKTQPLTEKELHDLRMMYLTRFYLTEETVAAQRSMLADYELVGRGIKEADRFLEKINAVTAEDIQRVAKTYLKNYQFTYLGDPKQVDEEVFLAY